VGAKGDFLLGTQLNLVSLWIFYLHFKRNFQLKCQHNLELIFESIPFVHVNRFLGWDNLILVCFIFFKGKIALGLGGKLK